MFLEKKLISLAKFMRIVSNNYYSRRMPLGIDGDFITSPEISQVFGEIIALWLMQKWHQLGRPKEISLVELGPGRGSLMSDLLRTIIKNEIHGAIKDIYLIEINHQLKELQEKNISPYLGNININWKSDIDNLAIRPTIFIANEFFDCLAINQYIYRDNHWHKTMVNPKEPISFSYVKTNYLKKPANEGDIIEVSADSIKLVKKIASYVAKNQGGSLIIDYGYIERKNLVSSLQGVKNHQYHDVLSDLGQVDLSAHVDFLKLVKSIKLENIEHYHLTTQAKFLIKYGIEIRGKQLYELASYQQKAQIAIAIDRLISNNKMGELFKVLEF
jgi:SAM-dependent MidA family methyltransferase